MDKILHSILFYVWSVIYSFKLSISYIYLCCFHRFVTNVINIPILYHCAHALYQLSIYLLSTVYHLSINLLFLCPHMHTHTTHIIYHIYLSIMYLLLIYHLSLSLSIL